MTSAVFVTEIEKYKNFITAVCHETVLPNFLADAYRCKVVYTIQTRDFQFLVTLAAITAHGK